MSVSQAEKAKKFRALHEAPGAFVIANPWDAGSARMLAGLGFEALATSSGAKAGMLGKRDGKVTREEALANAKLIVEACDLPVSADLEKGFGDGPDAAAETIRQAAGVGLVGGSIEDASGNREAPLYDVETATARVAAAVKAARALDFPFVLTARAEGFLRGMPDLDEVIKRLKSFEAAGVKRISLATSLYRAAMTGLLDAAKEVKERGTFTYLDHAIPTPDLNAFMKE